MDELVNLIENLLSKYSWVIHAYFAFSAIIFIIIIAIALVTFVKILKKF